MEIGIDATCWQNTRGYGRHARALLTALVNLDAENHYTFFMDSKENVASVPASADVRFIEATAPTTLAASANGHRSAHDMWRMSRAMSSAALDILVFPTIYTYVPVLSRARKIVMIHDVIAETYPRLTLPRRSARLFWKAKVAFGRWQADAIATVSDYSRLGLMKHFGLKEGQVHVVNEASDPVFRVLDSPVLTQQLKTLGLNDNDQMIVYVGGFSPHKNLTALVDAFAQLASESSFSNAKLVLVGEYRKEVFHSYAGTIQERVSQLGIQDKVVFTGYLPDEELVILLNLATVSVLPSLMEGFGLPAVEAAACGCPVIATRESPLPALLGDGCIYIDPGKPDELQNALGLVLGSDTLRQKMSEVGKEAANRLTWDAAARQLAGIIEKVAHQ